ncbi:MAG: type VI secretion system baseplate subunit TssK [Gammaproteobacteria bacterium HGW-Gammaproteobacteria-8]|nr:MAG: type VI secretion system baseplate subunit TssK [Gammaproteobacteria bacterium HGW-Gammaproteobacteria-8]
MSWKNRVIWSEGMFLRPQHFQQLDRYTLDLVEGRVRAARPDAWGFGVLKLDQAALKMGKLALERAQGIFPDGTPFSIPAQDSAPQPLDVPENLKNSTVFLGLPVTKPGRNEYDLPGGSERLTRFRTQVVETRDAMTGSDVTADIEVGEANTRILTEGDDRSEYSCIPMARIVERRADGTVVTDSKFIPTVYNCLDEPVLHGLGDEVLGLLKHRAEALAARVSDSGRGGVAEIADFLLLIIVNRSIPLLAHLCQRNGLHPEDFYRLLVALAGELAAFSSPDKMARGYPAYRHAALSESFDPVLLDLRNALSMVIEQNAIAIPLVEKKYGVRVGRIPDRGLIGSALFVLAARAAVPSDQLRSEFPRQVKIGSVEVIRDLVNKQVRGIGTEPLPVAPREIPYHAGFNYFELERKSDYWTGLKNSGGIAIHVSGEYPDLELELWAIRGS